MSNNQNSSKTQVPQAKEALNKFKMEVANELGVPLQNGYNGSSGSQGRQSSSTGGGMNTGSAGSGGKGGQGG